MDLKATAYNSDGEVIKCDKCPEDAGMSIMGQDKVISLCVKCYYGNEERPRAAFVYRPPQDGQEITPPAGYTFAKAPKILNELYVVDLRKKDVETEESDRSGRFDNEQADCCGNCHEA